MIVTIYVCENCGRLGPIEAFQDDCRVGWTHGRLYRVKEVRPEDRGAVWAAVAELGAAEAACELSRDAAVRAGPPTKEEQ